MLNTKLGLKIIVLLQCVFDFTIGGHIDLIDYNIDFPHLNLARNLDFTFSLETELPSDAFLKITLPFQIDSGGVGMKAWLTDYDRPNCSPHFPQELSNCIITKSILAEDAGKNSYWIQFLSATDNSPMKLT